MLLVGVAAVACVGVILLTTRGARWTAFALVCVAVLTAPMIDARFAAWLLVADVALVAAVILFLVARTPIRPAGYGWPVLALWLIALGGLLAAGGEGVDSGALINLGKFVIASGVPLVTLAALRPSRSEVTVLAWCYVAGALISGAFGVLPGQSIGGRIEGLSGHPNHLGLAVGMALPVSLALGLRQHRLSSVVCAAALGVALVASGSRSGALAALAGVVALLIRTQSRRVASWTAVSVGAGIVLLWLGVIDPGKDSLLGRLTGSSPTGESNASRALLAQNAWAAIEESPIIGSGFAEAREVHSVPLELWQSAGLFGAMAFAVLLAVGVRGWRRTGASMPEACGLWCAYVGYLAAAPFGTQLWDRYVWVLLALALAASRIRPDARPVDDNFTPAVSRR